MKNRIIKSSIVLIVFSFSILVFNLSCEEPVQAQQQEYVLPPATATTLGGIKVGDGLSVTSDGTLSVTEGQGGQPSEPFNRFLYVFYNDNTAETEFWTAEFDGSDNKKIPISLPAGLKISGQTGTITPDGQTLIFAVRNNDNKKYIYSVSLDGSGLKQIIDGSATTGSGIIYDIMQTY